LPCQFTIIFVKTFEIIPFILYNGLNKHRGGKIMEYHVAKYGSDENPGTWDKPFLTINKAAQVAQAGDVVIVHEGIYREWVKPKNKGLSDKRRITYKAADGERVVIKGSEQVSNWEHVKDNVWKVVIPDSFFGDYNPYKLEIFGDWLVTRERRHLGEVYLNGMSFYEVNSYDELFSPPMREEVFDHGTWETVKVKNKAQTRYVWYCETDGEKTTIYANFQGHDPNSELVEINVRPSCFYPEKTGVDYITVSGFEMAHAASPWAPPTANQIGLIGPNWAKGWIIENNIIHDAKCSAISLGKEASTGENYRSTRMDKPGYQYQLEAVFLAEKLGWGKETVGSHIVRHNTIYDCGQNAIVGHMGCVFSEIHHNHIYNIGIKREFFGYEIAGIKFHAPLDTYIHHNIIHDCTLGMWCDWQTQGTRVSKNIFYENNRDLYIEVSHGPYIVDNNIFASKFSLMNWSQGGAYINNLFCGKIANLKILNRATPYHFPHSTKVKGYALIYGGDDRYYNNIFAGDGSGTAYFNGHTTSLEEYIKKANERVGDVEEYEKVGQPVYINNNVYLNGAKAFDREEEKLVDHDHNPNVKIINEKDGLYLSINLPKGFDSFKGIIHSTDTLARARIVDQEFENPDGSKVFIDTDLLGEKHQNATGPLAKLKDGENLVKIW